MADELTNIKWQEAERAGVDLESTAELDVPGTHVHVLELNFCLETRNIDLALQPEASTHLRGDCRAEEGQGALGDQIRPKLGKHE
ncbi:MAG: hypothetical protein AB7I30_18395 [Isosphaeraceae bacterium]